MLLTSQLKWLCRISLSFLWLFTAATSFWWARDLGYEVLALQNIHGTLADWCINLGSLFDLLLGLWLLTPYKLKWCCGIQIMLILSYSILLTLIAPQFWLHPFGPLTKNIPILVLIYVVYSNES